MRNENEPIAIVGIGCRFPGGINSLDSYWTVLRDGKDMVTEIDDHRWGKEIYFHPDKQTPGKTYTWAAGVLPDVDMFDASFFGISPREARQMDPQQRLLLEMAWEALEDGGQIPDHLAGTKCAVYLGLSSTDYRDRRIDDPSSGDAYFMTGNTLSVAANRVSYVLDLRGPSMTIDTACSSSLVALHEACTALQSGLVPMALCGGVNLLLSPLPFIGFSQATMLSPRGRCRVFDVGGDGYVRSEGGAMLFIKPLRQAERDGDPIHAVILASASNCDGRGANSLTLPSADGQEALLRDIYHRTVVDLNALAYIEAHGTGTPVGDPAECAAIGHVIGHARRPDNPILVGSAKSNIGHLEPASAMAGLLKVVLALKHRVIPPSLHLEELNPAIDFKALNLRPVTELTPLVADAKPLYMGVNSFGFGGANAHVLVAGHEAGAAPQTQPFAAPLPSYLMLSARSEGALDALAKAYSERLTSKDVDHYGLLYGSALRRQQHDYRLVITGRTVTELKHRLQSQLSGDPAPGVVRGRTLTQGDLKTAWVFSGNGCQWPGMGRHLLAHEPVFQQAIAEVDRLFKAYGGGFSLLRELEIIPDKDRLGLTEVAQPALFAVQVGLVELLRSRGVQAQAAVGHSVGEVAAAWACGALNLEQAVMVIHRRSAAQARTRGSGSMAALGLSSEQTLMLLKQLGVRLEIAGYNAPNSVTLSGDLKDLERVATVAAAEGVFYRPLDLEYAFHSARMDAIEDVILGQIGDLRPAAGEVPFFSTVTGGALSGQGLDAGYWWRNVRRPVRFCEALSAMIDAGTTLFIEVGAHPILRSYIHEALAQAAQPYRHIATLRRGAEDEATLVDEAVAAAHVAGATLDLSRLFPVTAPPVALPPYPWQRERHWVEMTSEGMGLSDRHYLHPLLGYPVRGEQATWESHIDSANLSYLADHVVAGAVVFPAAAFMELALAASQAYYGGDTQSIEDLEISAPLVLDKGTTMVLRFVLSTDDGRFIIKGRMRLKDATWVEHAKGRMLGNTAPSPIDSMDLEQERRRCPSRTDPTEHYRRAEEHGLYYGPRFRVVEEAFVGDGRVFGKLGAAAGDIDQKPDYLVYPPLLDGAFQLLLDLRDSATCRATRVPYRVRRLHLMRRAKVAYARLISQREHRFSALFDVLLTDHHGRPIAKLEEVRTRDVPTTAPARGPKLFQFHAELQPSAEASLVAPELDLSAVIHNALASFGKQTPEGRDRQFAEAEPAFDALISRFALEAMIPLLTKEGASLEIMIERSALDSTQRPYLEWLLHILEEDGRVAQESGGWRLRPLATDGPDAASLWRRLLRDYPAYLAELTMIGRRGRQLLRMRDGCTESDTPLFPPQASSTLELFFEASPSSRPGNLLGREVVRAMLAAWPVDRRIRVLLLDVGDPGLRRQLFSLWPRLRTDMVVAVAQEERLASIAAEHEALDWVDVVHWNLDADGAQALPPDPLVFDLAITSHVSITHTDRGPVLDLLRQRLAENGVLLILEHAPDRFRNFSFGADPRWWEMGANGERPTSRLIPASQWQDWLVARQMDAVSVVSDKEPGAEDVFIVLARNPERRQEPQTPPRKSKETHKALAAQTWLLLCDPDGESADLAAALSQRLHSAGARVVTAAQGARLERPSRDQFILDCSRADDVRGLFGAFSTDGAESLCIVHLLGWQRRAENGIEDLMALQERRCLSAAALANAADTHRPAGPFGLWLVTAGGAPVSSCEAQAAWTYSPSQSPLWGLGRVLMNEHPELGCRLIDLQGQDELERLADRLYAELASPGPENEILLGPSGRHVLRMRGLPRPDRGAGANPSSMGPPEVRLGFSRPGLLRNLRWEAVTPRRPQQGEVRIAVRAAGLNFRDVMYTMGLLPDEALENGFAGPTLGLEVAGDVTDVGPGVKDFRAGDAVLCSSSAGFASHVTTKADMVLRKPAAWSYEAAATVPAVFFTVHYALVHLARLQPGERLLVHGAAGGVGIAAIQYARHLGAEIFATAGTGEKREFVRLLGADHVLDSRSLSFAVDVMALTGGEGVDIVLNSLAGEAVRRGLDVLRPFGRFLELGKRDFYANSRIGLRPFRNNIAYFGIDADQVMQLRPRLASRLFNEMMELFADGVLSPLPHRIFPHDRVVDAFQAMQQSRHIGKLVLSIPVDAAPEAAVALQSEPLRVDQNGTYLVTGGLSGFGLATARWLVSKGARHLALLGRRGADTPGATSALHSLSARGAQVQILQADVADNQQLQSVLKDIEKTAPPLRGVVHAAMVLDDGLLRNLDRPSLRAVLAPKVLGAWNLHHLTQHLQLDLFVLYSSATTFLGNPGQANYVAANSYLESLVHFRRSRGLTGLFVAWGAIDDVGYLARNPSIKDSLQLRLGGAALSSAHALSLLERLLLSDSPGAAVTELDWSRLRQAMPAAEAPKYVAQQRATKETPGDDTMDEIRSILVNLSSDEASARITALLVAELGRILRVSQDRIDVTAPITDLGMDSLMGVELGLAVEQRLGAHLPMMLISQGATVARLTDHILANLREDANKADSKPFRSAVSTPDASTSPF